MAEHASSREDREAEPTWLVAPDLPTGTRLQLNIVTEAEQLTPEVMSLLSKAVDALQESASAGATQRVTCPKLRNCGNYVGGCPNLTKCDNYALK
jgi:hypothetical protein